MILEEIKNVLPDYAKDVKLNLSTVLAVDATGGLTQKQINMVALASAYATQLPLLIAVFESESKSLSTTEVDGVKAATMVMAMNNVYYRYTHSVSDHEFSQLPARLRMNIMANPGIDKNDFELCSLAISAINGCSACMDSHTTTLVKHGIAKTAIQQAVKIAAVIQALAQVLIIEKQRVELVLDRL